MDANGTGVVLVLSISEQLEWSCLTSSNANGVLKYIQQACPLLYAGTRRLPFPHGHQNNAKTLTPTNKCRSSLQDCSGAPQQRCMESLERIDFLERESFFFF